MLQHLRMQLQPTRINHRIHPARHPQHPILNNPSIRGDKPTIRTKRPQHRRRQRRSTRKRPITPSNHRARHRNTLTRQRHPGPRQRPSIINNPPGCFRTTVSPHHIDPQPLTRHPRVLIQGRPTNQNGIKQPQRLNALQRLQRLTQLKWHQRGIPGKRARLRIQPPRSLREHRHIKTLRHVNRDRHSSSHKAAHKHLNSCNMMRRQRQQPHPRPPKGLMRRVSARHQIRGAQQRALRHTRRPGRRNHQSNVLVDRLAYTQSLMGMRTQRHRRKRRKPCQRLLKIIQNQLWRLRRHRQGEKQTSHSHKASPQGPRQR